MKVSRIIPAVFWILFLLSAILFVVTKNFYAGLAYILLLTTDVVLRMRKLLQKKRHGAMDDDLEDGVIGEALRDPNEK